MTPTDKNDKAKKRFGLCRWCGEHKELVECLGEDVCIECKDTIINKSSHFEGEDKP